MAITISGNGITSANIADGTITNADINASAAIDGSKISGDFGKVLQVVSTTKTDTFTTTSSSFTDITGMSVSITPSSSSSKILVFANIHVGHSTSTNRVHTRILRGSTAIGVGDLAGNRQRSNSFCRLTSQYEIESHPLSVLDLPATTSNITYKLQIFNPNGGTACFNRSGAWGDSSDEASLSSTITVMEIGA